MKLKQFILFVALITSSVSVCFADYPAHWWKPVPPEEAKGWEVLPQDALPGELILSKRNELGIFSNLSYSPFILDEVLYNSVEGLWQGMKYPDPTLSDDPRLMITSWPHTRQEVYLMSGWDSKNAGNAANEIYDQNRLRLISYKNQQFRSGDKKEGAALHLKIITDGIREKVKQNPEIKALLLSTKGLILRPDHYISDKDPESHKYHLILMKIRDELE